MIEILFILDFFKGERDTPICGDNLIHCYARAELNIILLSVLDTEDDSFNLLCDCLPACTSITYNAEISQAKIDANKMAIAYNYDDFQYDGYVCYLLYMDKTPFFQSFPIEH